MNPPIPPQPPADFKDPRSAPGFLPQFIPRANGQDAPRPDSAPWEDRVMLEFLAIYYELNHAYSQLLQAKIRTESSGDASEQRRGQQCLEQWLVRRDALEDRYAPAGVIAEPVYENGFTVNVQFRFGSRDALGRRRFDAYTVATFVPIPWPEGKGFADLPISVRDPREG
jgi:hypothetical protein